MANTPIIKKRNGAFSVAVFEDKKQNKAGESYTAYSVVLQKSYKDQGGEWQRQTINMFDNNVAEVALMLQAVAFDLMSAKPSEAQAESPAQTKSVEPELDSDLPF